MNLPASLPGAPGCYLFRDLEGTILYVGKAKDLKKRVSSYFQKRDHDPKTRRLVSLVADIDYIVTGNEVEALILENSLIKTHQPRFNIDLKDAKQYAYIHLTDEEFPRICIARRMTGKGSYFGPFTSAAERDHVLSVVKKTFGLRSCRKLTRRGCLRASLGTCSAPCRAMVSREEYEHLVHRAALVLKGNTPEIIRTLKSEMDRMSDAHEYERALLLRDQVQALEHLSRRQDMARKRDTDEDIINFLVHDGRVYLMLFNIHQGTLVNKKEFIFDEGEEFLEEFLVQHYSEHTPPGELILPVEIGVDIQEFLSLQKGRKVSVGVPRIGARRRLLSLVRTNIEIAHFGDQIRLEELREKLAMDDLPHVIECFDISHLAGTEVVGSMVQFRDGHPDKRNYRRFRIRTVEGIDDPGAIAEVVNRRYRRLRDEANALPDLVMVDGGRTQLQAAHSALKGLGLAIPVIALAKKEEKIYVPGSAHPLPVQKHEKASLYLQEIRDEAHRFAITYHRLLRKKKVIP
ncbi:MAG: excinuclease ABC subunit UvrC [Methanolinea sp.]|nr:excinuclease ABC subunit UvrC [Methanolinea sp.]